MGVIYDSFKDKQLAGLILYATLHDMQKTESILEQVNSGNLKIVPVYPGMGEKVPKNAECIGSIMDGALYLLKLIN